MNPPRKTSGLFLTPRAPYGRRLTDRAWRHMHASDTMAGQEGPDQLKQRADIQREMDKNNVPRGLQGEISPERAGEITDPSRLPLPSPKIPRMTNRMFPLDPQQQPLPAQALPATAGAGVLRPATPGQQMPKPDEADKAWEKKKPEKDLLKNPLNYKGIEVTPSVSRDGVGVGVGVPWDKIFRKP